MTKLRPPFRLTKDEQLAQMKILVHGQPFALPTITREEAIALLARGQARLDLKNRRLIVAFDISNSLPGATTEEQIP